MATEICASGLVEYSLAREQVHLIRLTNRIREDVQLEELEAPQKKSHRNEPQEVPTTFSAFIHSGCPSLSKGTAFVTHHTMQKKKNPGNRLILPEYS